MDNSSLRVARRRVIDCWYMLDSVGTTMVLLLGRDTTKDVCRELEEEIYPEIASIHERLSQMKESLMQMYVETRKEAKK